MPDAYHPYSAFSPNGRAIERQRNLLTRPKFSGPACLAPEPLTGVTYLFPFPHLERKSQLTTGNRCATDETRRVRGGEPQIREGWLYTSPRKSHGLPAIAARVATSIGAPEPIRRARNPPSAEDGRRTKITFSPTSLFLPKSEDENVPLSARYHVENVHTTLTTGTTKRGISQSKGPIMGMHLDNESRTCLYPDESDDEDEIGHTRLQQRPIYPFDNAPRPTQYNLLDLSHILSVRGACPSKR